jgi:glycosyltransferase involved in cell wall biosynthesis
LLVSIITVTLNSKSVLSDCLDSVANQSHNNIEHIVIDGGSTDGTLTLLNSRRKNLAIVISEPDNGIYEAMNKGVALAKGDIVGILNSDDFYANDQVISNIIEIFTKDPSLEACYADLIYVDRYKTSKIIRYFKSSKFEQGLFSKGWSPPHPTFFVRRSVYEKFGLFNLNYRIASDIDLMIRFFEIHKIKTKYVPEIWVKMRMGGTTNKSLKNIYKQNQEILKSFKQQGLHVNTLGFLINKILNRLSQFLRF